MSCENLTGNLVIPDSVTVIDEWAFNQCNGFNGTLTLSSSLESIGSYAFAYCRNFTGDLTIPNTVTTIDDMAFYYCEAMNGKLTLSSEVTALGRYAFYGCYAFSGELVIPSKVETIGEWAFAYDRSLTSLKFNSGLKQIDPYAFYNCSSLKDNIVIPNTVTTIGDYAFHTCSNVTKLYIGSGVTSMGSSCFGLYSEKTTKLYTKNQTVLDYDWSSNKRTIVPMNTLQVTLPEEIILKPKYLNNQAAPIWYASFNIEVSGDFEDGSYGTFSKVPTFNITTTSGEQITITTDIQDTTVTEDGDLVIPVTFTAPNPTLLKDYSGTFELNTVLHEIVPFAA